MKRKIFPIRSAKFSCFFKADTKGLSLRGRVKNVTSDQCALPWGRAHFLFFGYGTKLIKGKEKIFMQETRVAIIGIIVEDYASADALNDILHHYGSYIIGRMGIPYREKRDQYYQCSGRCAG